MEKDDVNLMGDGKNSCELCNSKNVQQCSKLYGKLAIYGLWWIGIGFLIHKISKYPFCENCFQNDFEKNAKGIRIMELCVDDRSKCDPPELSKSKVEKKIDANLLNNIIKS
ncbi:unnamed protein product [Caenorhabditis angaria]|uniref:LITAF domain-containing protein n=1 Tax=Caenorhabditis angaria TaxID=860376 RepID=A0A9P1IS50_9PELO|nr:unnamed protein product [Caenorhabditis angaria]